MKRIRAHYRVRIGLAVLVFMTIGGTAEAGSSALQELASIRASKAGVDAKNNFWAWDSIRRVMTRITPNGDRFESDILPESWGTDADQERGIASLTEAGREIEIYDWNGTRKRSIRLLHPASDVAWLSGSHVAVTPKTTGPCVEIWDAATGTYLSGFGTCPDIALTHPGALPARATLVRYDQAHREIVTFDAFRGDLIAFSESGTITRRGHVENPNAVGLEVWVKQMDTNAQNRRETSTPDIRPYPSITIAPDRSVWLGERADSGGLTGVAILQDGTVQRTRLDVPGCPSIRFVAWNENLVFYRDPRLAQPACAAVRRRK